MTTLVELDNQIIEYSNQLTKCISKVNGYRQRLDTEELRDSTRRDCKVMKAHWEKERDEYKRKYFAVVEAKNKLVEEGGIEYSQCN